MIGVMDAVFTYGTLEIPQVMKAVTGLLYQSRPAVFKGYARFLVKGEIFPGVIRDDEEETLGTLYLAVNGDSLLLIDCYEGSIYQRRAEEVRTLDGEWVTAWVYVIPETRSDLLEYTRWNKEEFVAKYMTQFINEHARYGRSR